MNIDELKWRVTSRRHQLVQLDVDGRLLGSCDSIVPLKAYVGAQVLEAFHIFDGMHSDILGLRLGDPVLHLPMMQFSFQGTSYHLTFEFWADEGVEGILWLMSSEDIPSERLRQIQQDRNETSIGLEKVMEQEQALREYTVRLELAHETLQRFAYVVSHDLRAPLRAIGNIALWIEEGIAAGDLQEVNEHLKLLRNRAERMESLVDGIARYHRVGRMQQEMGFVDLRALLEELIATIFTDRVCTMTLPNELPPLYCCRTGLYQIFSNLVSNVAKYGNQDDCKIVVGYQDLGQFHAFSVSDNGPGIDPRHHKRIFEVFQTLQSKDDFESTGIGLSIVQRIVEEHGGKVWVESELGQGATFWFTWSKVDAPESEVAESHQS